MKYFPTLIVDDFLKDPIVVMDYAKTLEFSYPEDYRYPGLRSKSLSETNYDLFKYVGNLILSCYGIRDNFSWNAHASFQIVDNDYSVGWIHSDNVILTSIIYLSDNLNSGTSLYKNSEFWKIDSCNEDTKRSYYKKMSENRCYKINQNELAAAKENNEPFIETLNVKALFNRMVSFESSEFHGANELEHFKEDSVRLTLLYFFNEINVKNNQYPLIRV